jgi:hypothetical protein
VKYVRKRVIPSGNARRKALQELDDLGRNPQVVPDCSALKTKLTLLISHTVVSDRGAEPCSRPAYSCTGCSLEPN